MRSGIRWAPPLRWLLFLLLLLPGSRAMGQAGGPAPLRVLVGKSLVVQSPEPLKRVAVSDPSVASAIVISRNQVLIHGLTPGTVSLLLWDEQERAESFDLRVEFDLATFREVLSNMFPDEEIQVQQVGTSLILSGEVSTPEVIERAESLAQTQSQQVVNLLKGREVNEVVLLQVRFAEVDRSAVQELGLNVFSTGAGNTIGNLSTQQFQQAQGNVGAVPADVQRGRDPATPSLAAGGIGNSLQGTPAVIGLSDLLNLFLFRPDINLGLTLRALEQRNLLQILAEPNVLALNGREASFLAGGEFPFPVVQGVAGVTSVTIEFKEFGVRLNFTPEILPDGLIRLKVAPEVSSLDFANALTVSGFLVPAISTRRAETEIELKDGQSFAIAGLIDDRFVEVSSKIPLLGDIPFFGKLFRSRQLNRNNTELMVLVTPRLVSPLNPDQVPEGPEFPAQFLDKEKFDEKSKPKQGGAN